MTSIASGLGERYVTLGESQDHIGWRRFLEGMISREILPIQEDYMALSGSRGSIDEWAKELITRLLECTHGQWLYRNVHVHDHISGTHANRRKEALRRKIEEFMETADGNLAEEDKYLLEINFDNWESTSGESQEYWFLALEAAVENKRLQDNEAHDVANGTDETRA